MYDIIGDVHGHYIELHRLLLKMGYSYDKETHCFHHDGGRRAVFIGDYIDKGSENLKVINLVRNMVDAGNAHAIMGNHDFNAVQLATPDRNNKGEYVRPHTDKNLKQNKSFLDEVAFGSDLYLDAIEWFKTLPVYLSLGQLNFVHACWYPSAIERLEKTQMITEEGRLTEQGWLAAADKQSSSYELIEILLKGPEEKLGNSLKFEDAYGIERSVGRVAWWQEKPQNYNEAFTSLPLNASFLQAAYKPTSDNNLSKNIRDDLQAMDEEAKIFIGHIWQTGTPKPLSDKIACVDYSVAKADKLAAYRWYDGDAGKSLSPHNYVWVPSVDAPAAKANKLDNL